jgi:hypothetical protein
MSVSLKNAKVVGEIAANGKMTVRLVPDMAAGAWADEDWGSAVPACIFSIRVCVASGKDGIAYPVKTAKMSGTSPADLVHPRDELCKVSLASSLVDG